MKEQEASSLREQAATLPGYGVFSVAVPNVGNTARDHLVNERTYLAWIRTAIAILSLGLAIAKFDTTEAGALTGALFIILSMVLFAYALRRYTEVTDSIYRGEYMVMRKGAILLSALFAAVAVVCTTIIFHQFWKNEHPASSLFK